eukprot:GHVH01017446.1.p2 GENE.GHVH01017446.1~~GHVH01017446.1.p2  ORF type:complete len:657 (+),score=111.72 GHVH01017446.1:2286-4256(+)
MENSVFDNWVAIADAMQDGRKSHDVMIGSTEDDIHMTPITTDVLLSALESHNTQHLIGDDHEMIPLCIVVVPDNGAKNPKSPGDRPFEESILDNPIIMNDKKQNTDKEDRLFCDTTAKFIDQFRKSTRGGEGICGRDGIHQTLIENCLAPHHEWVLVSLGDPLSTVEQLCTVRVGNELGMTRVAVESSAKKMRRQMLALLKLFRCYRVARNAVHQMALSGAVTTFRHHQQGCVAPHDGSHVVNALCKRPVVIDVVVEDDQCRIKDFVVWDMFSMTFNKFAYDCVESIMLNGGGEALRQSDMNVGGTSLVALMHAHQGVKLEQSTLNHEPNGPKPRLPERMRVAIDVGVRRAMIAVIVDFCIEVDRVWTEFLTLDGEHENAGPPAAWSPTSSTSLATSFDLNSTVLSNTEDQYDAMKDEPSSDRLPHAPAHRCRETMMLKLSPLEYSEFISYTDPHDVSENIPYFMAKLWKSVEWMGSVSIPPKYQSLFHKMLGRTAENNVPDEERSVALIEAYLRIGVLVSPWDPYSSLRQAKERVIKQQRAQEQQAEIRRLAHKRMAERQGSPSSNLIAKVDSEEVTSNGPRRSTRVRAKQQTLTLNSLRQKIRISSSSDSDRKQKRSRKVRKRNSESEDEEELWGHEEEDESSEDGSEVSDASE